LAGRPELLNELYEEALTIDKECNGSLTVAYVQKMVKLDSFVKESLRHHDDISKHNFNSPYILNYIVTLKYHILFYIQLACLIIWYQKVILSLMVLRFHKVNNINHFVL
jgi:hypothetical protein